MLAQWIFVQRHRLKRSASRGADNHHNGRRRGRLRRCRLGSSRVCLTSCSSGYIPARHSQHPGSGTPFILASHTAKWHAISLYVPFYDVLFYTGGRVFWALSGLAPGAFSASSARKNPREAPAIQRRAEPSEGFNGIFLGLYPGHLLGRYYLGQRVGVRLVKEQLLQLHRAAKELAGALRIRRAHTIQFTTQEIN